MYEDYMMEDLERERKTCAASGSSKCWVVIADHRPVACNFVPRELFYQA